MYLQQVCRGYNHFVSVRSNLWSVYSARLSALSNRVFGKVEKFLGAHNFYYGGCLYVALVHLGGLRKTQIFGGLTPIFSHSHLVRVMQFSKKIDPEILVDALDDLHVRHPMLSQEIIRAPIVGTSVAEKTTRQLVRDEGLPEHHFKEAHLNPQTPTSPLSQSLSLPPRRYLQDW
jgi:hypothetical protein